jgi:predicted Zn-dependent peptidase
LVEDLERSFDNKSKYASKRFNEEMYKNESFKYSSIGTIDELKNVKGIGESLFNELKDLVCL